MNFVDLATVSKLTPHLMHGLSCHHFKLGTLDRSLEQIIERYVEAIDKSGESTRTLCIGLDLSSIKNS